MSENAWFYTGLAVLAVAAYYVPSLMGLDRWAAFVVGVAVSSVYVWGFKAVADWVGGSAEEEEEEVDRT